MALVDELMLAERFRYDLVIHTILPLYLPLDKTPVSSDCIPTLPIGSCFLTIDRFLGRSRCQFHHLPFLARLAFQHPRVNQSSIQSMSASQPRGIDNPYRESIAKILDLLAAHTADICPAAIHIDNNTNTVHNIFGRVLLDKPPAPIGCSHPDIPSNGAHPLDPVQNTWGIDLAIAVIALATLPSPDLLD